MRTWPFSADRLRAMYAGGRGDATARRFSRLWAAVFGLGLMPRRWVTLEVTGRRSGKLTRFPMGMADLAGQWYLVPMLGEQCNWVRNVRAADGRVTPCSSARCQRPAPGLGAGRRRLRSVRDHARVTGVPSMISWMISGRLPRVRPNSEPRKARPARPKAIREAM